jgi:dihydrodipicolinate synthase/N-acetylneuraminate lyase
MKLARETPVPPKPQGVYAAAITPRRAGEVEVDLGAMLEGIDFVSSRGVDGIALFGSTGEFVHFTADERSRFVALATKRSRVPILANVSHSTLDGAVAMAEEAAGAGVAGVMVMPPYYFRYDDESVCTFLRDFAAQVSRWTPIYLYNIPVFTNPISIEIAEALLRSGQYAGIKDSGGDWNYLDRLLRLSGELPLSILCGDDRLFARARRAGASAGVSGIAAAVPELMSALNHAIQNGDQRMAARLESWVDEFVAWAQRFPAPVAVREAAVLRKVKAGPLAAPLGGEKMRLLDEFRAWFRNWIPVVENECKNALR